MVVLMVLSSNIGNVLLSKGMKEVGAVHLNSLEEGARLLGSVLANSYIWLGIASLILYGVFYLVLLSWADYSWILPASAGGYAVVPLFGYALLGELVSPMRWAGIGLICAGVFLVGATPPRSERPV
jgi:drug/metabolite transporter (DMT)-like permease